MTKEERFYIDCYGICDTWKNGKTCKEVKLSWAELCDILNELHENVDTDVQELLIENKKLKESQEQAIKIWEELGKELKG